MYLIDELKHSIENNHRHLQYFQGKHSIKNDTYEYYNYWIRKLYP